MDLKNTFREYSEFCIKWNWQKTGREVPLRQHKNKNKWEKISYFYTLKLLPTQNKSVIFPLKIGLSEILNLKYSL